MVDQPKKIKDEFREGISSVIDPKKKKEPVKPDTEERDAGKE